MSSVEEELRYGFGKNWAEFVEKSFNEEVVDQSRAGLCNLLRADSLRGKVFLDIGCGSGVHSLAAHRLGAARIVSFDYDRDSVATTAELRRRAGEPANWEVRQGSVLDPAFMKALPPADIVYSWGVLHHTGDMWTAVRNAAVPLKPDGVFYIALYSSDIYLDPSPEYWIKVKRRYNRAGPRGRRLMEWWYVGRFLVLPALKSGQNPLSVIRNYGHRGMTFWTDAKDWLGGYPIEFAGLAETQEFCKRELDLDLVNLKTGEGCTEYVFCRLAENAEWRRTAQQRQLKLLPGPYVAQGGARYAASVPVLADEADGPAAPARSRLMLYEDGQLLGLAHTRHDQISNYGKGRFSHWGADVHFSATDNSDPNSNGRHYSYCERF
ncbi:MAG TPA: class I SAM-dependent methyltransferase [Stellaceae bacterium]|nr:class I SAM-dependent methyltransferase [Stellaceae bacterium]